MEVIRGATQRRAALLFHPLVEPGGAINRRCTTSLVIRASAQHIADIRKVLDSMDACRVADDFGMRTERRRRQHARGAVVYGSY